MMHVKGLLYNCRTLISPSPPIRVQNVHTLDWIELCAGQLQHAEKIKYNIAFLHKGATHKCLTTATPLKGNIVHEPDKSWKICTL